MCMVIRYLPVTSAIIVSVHFSGLVYTDFLVLKPEKRKMYLQITFESEMLYEN